MISCVFIFFPSHYPLDDSSRVTLQPIPGIPNSEYINGNFIDVSIGQAVTQFNHNFYHNINIKHKFTFSQWECRIQDLDFNFTLCAVGPEGNTPFNKENSFKSQWDLTHSEWRPQNIYSQEEINLYCIIKLATEISLFSLQMCKTWCFV